MFSHTTTAAAPVVLARRAAWLAAGAAWEAHETAARADSMRLWEVYTDLYDAAHAPRPSIDDVVDGLDESYCEWKERKTERGAWRIARPRR